MSQSLKEVAQSLKEVIEWVIKKKFLAGEMYDLTASSTIGLEGFETGKLKNEYGLIDGISESLYKYKKELEIILKDETDDKFAKRREINYMISHLLSIDNAMQIINEANPASFDKLFKFTTNYLNGGNGSSQFNEQSLIITVAGGNPLKIFFQILAYLYNKGNSVNIDDFILKYYKNTTNISELKDILTNLKTLLDYDYNDSGGIMKDTKLEEKANEMHNTFPLLISDLVSRIEATVLNFSDMDFAIIPNKESILDELYKKQHGGVGSPRSKRPRIITPRETFQQTQE